MSRAHALGIALLLATHAALAWAFAWLADDAFIAFRHAWQAAHGQGLTWNPGPGAPVEGFSDLAWVALATLIEAVGVPAFRVMPGVSAACALLLLVLVERSVRVTLGLRPAVAAASVLLLAVSPPFVVWATSGLETMPHALAVLLAFHGLGPSTATWGPRVGSAALLAVLLLRAEGPLWAGGVLTAAALARRGAGRAASGWAGPIAGVAVAWLAVQGWRYATYGQLLPTPVVAKLDLSPAVAERGLRYVAGAAVALVSPVVLAAAVPTALSRRWRRTLAPLALLAAGPSAFAVAVGGDFMAFGRLLVAGLAPAVVLAAPALDRVAARGERRLLALVAALAVVGALPLANVHLAPEPLRRALDVRGPWPDLSEVERWWVMREATKARLVEGVALRQATLPGDRVVLGAIGARGYAAPRVVVDDLFGLVTPEVAERRVRRLRAPGHDKGVRVDFFYDERPTILGFTVLRADVGSAELDDALRVMTRRDRDRVYAPSLTVVSALSRPGCPVVALQLRHHPDDGSRATAWAAFGASRARLVAGPWSCPADLRLRDLFDEAARLPVDGSADPPAAPPLAESVEGPGELPPPPTRRRGRRGR